MLGSLAVGVYALSLSQLREKLGLALGVIVSDVIAICCCSIPVMLLLRKLEGRKKFTQLQTEEIKVVLLIFYCIIKLINCYFNNFLTKK